MHTAPSGGERALHHTEKVGRADPKTHDAKIGLWEWDLRTQHVYYSPEWKRLIGHEDGEVGHGFREWESRVHPEDLAGALAAVQACVEQRAPAFREKFRFRHRDGSYRWMIGQGAVRMDEQGRPIRFIGAHVEVADERKAEGALRDSEELHRLTLANISDTVLITDEEGKFRYVCPNVAVIFGYTPEEVTAFGTIERLLGPGLFHPADLRAKGELANIERPVTTKEGVGRLLLVNVRRVVIDGGTLLYTCRDITEREQTENIFRALVKGTAAVGEEFFQSLTRELATALGVRHAFVGEWLPEPPERVRTLAVWGDGQLAQNFEYLLAGTPCENVLRGELCFYPDQVRSAFPHDRLLEELGVVSYLGAPLFGSADQPLGLVVVMNDRPMPESERAKMILSVFAARAGAELERLQTERALRRSEERYRAIVEDQTEMIVRWKPDGTCTFVNQAYCHAVGKTPDQLLGACFAPGAKEENQEAIRQRAAALSAAGPVATFVHEYLSPTGKLLWEEWTDRGLFDAEGGLVEVQSSGRDVTERRRAEIRVRQLNRVYAVLSNINETIVREGDPPRLFHAACRIAVEKGGFRMAWIGLADAASGTFKPVAHAGLSAETLELLKEMFADPQRACAFTTHAARTDEHAVCNNIALDPRAAPWRELALERGYRAMASLPLKAGAEVIGAFNLYAGEVGFFDEQEMRLLDELALDISFALEVGRREAERRRAEAARAESEERFRQLTETIQDVFWMTDPAFTRMLYVSPAYERIWGRSCQSLYDAPNSWRDSIHAEDAERVERAAAELPKTGVFDEEYRIVREEGKIRWIRDRAFPVRDANGELVRLVGVARDVTVRRQLEEQLFQSQKMDAIGQLAGGVAHDFNNILAAILMQADLGTQNESVPEDVRFDLQQIRLYAERAANLTRQLLLFSRRQVIQSRELELNEIVTSLAKMLQRIIGEDVRLQLHLHPTPLFVRADAGMIDQVILNLAVNARDAMPQGGRLVLETSQRTIDREFAQLHPDAKPGRYAWLSVSDSGSGIPPEVLPRIFEPFFTTKPPGKGTGLGLATVYGIVQQHRGWIQVYSEQGRGATFQIFLPISESAPAAAAVAQAAPKPRGGTETILLAEDEGPVRTLVRAVLERNGYRVVEAATGDEAASLWGEHRERVALLITDLVMPGALSGYALAQKLLAENPRLKTIFLSGYSADLAGRELVLQAGENFLQKPFSPDQLLTAVRRCLDQ